jgi:uncharacterized protein (TIGR02246 family)
MMKKLFLFILSLTLLFTEAFAQDEHPIKKLLQEQTEAWNKGDLEAFMQTYWESDSLLFVSKNGVIRGWKNTLENYKKSYPDIEAMGQLTFDLIEIKTLSPQSYFVVGKWMLAKKVGDFSGYYTLLIRKINGQWKIVADHSS